MKPCYSIGVVVLVTMGVLAIGFLIPRLRTSRDLQDGRLRVVTTFAPLFIFATNVAGDAAQVENLLPSGVGPHDYSFTPRDIAKIADADVLIKQGRGLDDWIDEAIRAAGSHNLTVIVASEGIAPHTGSLGLDIGSGNVESAPALPLARPGPEDPHLWLDPFLAVQEVERIRDGLMARDPGAREIYARNAEGYLLRLLALDREIRSTLAAISERDFVSFHPSFRYFAYEYGLREIATIQEVPGAEPSAQELKQLIEAVRRTGVRVIFSEPQFSPQIVDLLRRDYGLQVAELDPLETGVLHPDYYEVVMRKNVEAIMAASQIRP